MKYHGMRVKLTDNYIRIVFDTPNEAQAKYIDNIRKLVPTHLQMYEAPNRVFLIGDPTNPEYLKHLLAHEMQELVNQQTIVLNQKKRVSSVLEQMILIKG
jgi:hypothetical protein